MSYIYVQEGASLSNQERKVLQAAARGLTCAETGLDLHIGFETVRTYRRSILVKLGARNITHAVALSLTKEKT